MHGLHTTDLHCPYCGERIEVLVDGSVGRQEYVEDCSVCCRPIVVKVAATPEEILSLQVRTEDE